MSSRDSAAADPHQIQRARRCLSDVSVRAEDSVAPTERWWTHRKPRPVDGVARRALRKRLRKVRRLAARCRLERPVPPELIHQLRVAIRRAEAALRVFAPLLPRGRGRWLRRRLQRLRRAAGKVRDFDVLEARLADAAALAEAADARTGLLLQAERERAARKLQRELRRVDRRRFGKSARQLVRRLKWRGTGPRPSSPAAARELLRPVAAACHAAAAEDLSDLARLHRFRVRVKRLRYACEVLRDDLPEAATVLQNLEQLQQQLGAICDRAAMSRLLSGPLPRLNPDTSARLQRRMAEEAKQLAEDHGRFREWWDNEGQIAFERAVGPLTG